MCGYGGDPGVMSQTIDRLNRELSAARNNHNHGALDFYNANMKIVQDENKKLRIALQECRSKARLYSSYRHDIVAIVNKALGPPKRKSRAKV